jgi:hypothetical protein
MKLDHRPNPSQILYGFLALGRERFLLQRDAAIRAGRVEASPAIAEIFAHVSPKKAREAEAAHLPNVDELMANVTVDIRGVGRNVNDAADRQRNDAAKEKWTKPPRETAAYSGPGGANRELGLVG